MRLAIYLTFLLIFLASQYAWGQQVTRIEDPETGTVLTDTTYGDIISLADSLLAPLDLSGLTTGILVDRSLATWDWNNFSGTPQETILTVLPTWNHRYRVHLRNARTSADKYDPTLHPTLSTLDSLFGWRGLPGEAQALTVNTHLARENTEAWYLAVKAQLAALDAARADFPNQLPRIRTWQEHLREVLPWLEQVDNLGAGGGDPATIPPLTFSDWTSLYGTLFLGTRDTLSPPIPSGAIVRERVVETLGKNAGAIPFIWLDAAYEQIKPTALENGLIAWENGQLHANGPSDAWLQKGTVLAVAPLLGRTTQTEVTFSFPANLYFTNQPEVPTSFRVDLGDGSGWQPVQLGTPLTASYPGPGTYSIILEVSHADGRKALAASNMLVYEEPEARAEDYSNTADRVESIESREVYLGKSGKGLLHIAYGCGSQQIRKPILIVPGIEHPQSNALSAVSPDAFGFFTRTSLKFQAVRQQWEVDGYDLIYLQYDDGADYMERNALLVEEAIRFIQAELQASGSDEPIGVVGFSMGGPVARYALARMEKNGEDHDVYRFVSVDSPHRGAHVPVAVQHAALHLPTLRIGQVPIGVYLNSLNGLLFLSEDLELWLTNTLELRRLPRATYLAELLNNPATRQLLREQVSGTYNSSQAVKLPSLYKDWLAKYEAMGRPERCEVVYLSNGNGIGIGQEVEASYTQPLFRFSNTPFIPVWAMMAFDPWTGPSALPLIAPIDASLSNFSPFKMEIVGYPQREELHLLYSAEIKVGLLGSILNLSKRTVFSQDRPAMDYAPGGNVTFSPIVDTLNQFPGITLAVDRYCYMPTSTGLNVDLGDQPNFYENLQVESLVDRGRTDADFVFAPSVEDVNIFRDTVYNYYHTFDNGGLGNVARRLWFDGRGASRNQAAIVGSSRLNYGGRMPRQFLTPFNLLSSDSLLINGEGRVGFDADQEEVVTRPGSDFQLSVIEFPNCNRTGTPDELRITNQSYMQVGSPSTTGTFNISAGNDLILFYDGTLRVYPGSRVVVGCGSTFRYTDEKDILTDGDETRLVIHGTTEKFGGGTVEIPYRQDYLSSAEIEGPRIVDAGVPQQFRILSPIEGAVYRWEIIDPDDQIIQTVNGARQFTWTPPDISACNCSSQTFTLQVSRQDQCYGDLPPLEIPVTVHQSLGKLEYPALACPLSSVGVTLTDLPSGANNIQWEVLDGIEADLINGNEQGALFRMGRDVLSFRMRYALAGNTIAQEGEVGLQTLGCPDGPEVILLSAFTKTYPNPTSDFVTLEIPLENPQGPYYYQITDNRGMSQHSWQTTELQTRISVEGFREGSYFLTVVGQNFRLSKLIFVKL